MRFLISLLICLIFLFAADTVSAASEKFITIVNPIRGSDFFSLPQKPVTTTKQQFEAIQDRGLEATWLVRPDALFDDEIVNFLKNIPPEHEIGLLMEVTPTWATSAGITYHQNTNWHDAGSVFLTGYSLEERRKLIDSAFKKFKEILKFSPQSVGAWWIDANSLIFMKQNYGIVANLDVADQYTTDNYQVWGQYFSTPFYPASRNALVPASGADQKIGVLTIQWAARDPYNSFGNGVLDSTYSVQANDYANPKYHNLTTDYFKKLLRIYLDNPYSSLGQVTVGLENDFSWVEYGKEYINQLETVANLQKTGVKVVTMSDFARRYSALFPTTSPPKIIFAQDPLGGSGAVVWYQTSKYRLGWFYTKDGSVIRDLREYFDSHDEPCLIQACASLNLAMMETKNLDEVSFGDRWLIDEGKISQIEVKPTVLGLQISYLNQANTKRTLEFLPNDIKIDGISRPISVAISQAISSSHQVTKMPHSFQNYLYENIFIVLFKQLKNLMIFLIFSAIFFYLPGLSVLRKTTLTDNEKFILSIPLGICLFTLGAFLLGFVKFYWGLLAIPLISILYLQKNLIRPKISWSREFLISSLLIIGASVVWLLTSVKNGLLFDYGLGFWGPNGHDAIWHFSLAERVKEGLPLQSPNFSNTVLTNYHYFYDLLLGVTSQLTSISVNDLYFRLYPLVLAIFIGILTYLLVNAWSNSRLAAKWSVFFVYFGGSFGWVLSYFKEKSLGGESLFWAQQSISTLLNHPLAISLLLFLAGLVLFQKLNDQKRQQALMIPLIILWGSLIEFKVYGGILVLASLFLLTLIETVKQKYDLIKLTGPMLILSALIFLPNNLAGGTLLIFSPFWLVHSMVDSVDRLNFARLSLARMNGLETGNYFKFLAAEVLGLIIFVIGNLGTRIVVLLSGAKFLKLNRWNLFMGIFLGLSLTIPLLFIQKGGSFNIVQFFYYFIFIFNLLAGISIAFLINQFKSWGKIFALVIVILTIPTTFDTLNHFLPQRPPARISRAELAALDFLRQLPQGVVLNFYYDERLKQKFVEPIPLLAYESTGYVGAFSGQREFLADTVNLNILGVDFRGRLQIAKDIFALREEEIVKRYLQEFKIKYIYTPKIADFTPDQQKFDLKSIYKNEEVEIFQNINL
ncbi:MAG: hypothetical protein HYW45_00720 [Candidatus Daviesbacteria bacterium]|nr:MAG: hypothetical protein HYW45_00720 [Candidatus Daviesbacteria bacterium]